MTARMLMLLLVLFVLLATPLLASDEVPLTTPACEDVEWTAPDVIAILDITTSKARFFVVDLAENSAVLESFKADLKTTCDLPTKNFQTLLKDITDLQTAKKINSQTDVRLFHGLNAVLRFYIFYKPAENAKPTDPPPFKLLVDEEERPTEFMRGLKILLEQAAKIKALEPQLAQGDYRIQNARGVITVKLRPPTAPTKPVPTEQTTKTATTNASSATQPTQPSANDTGNGGAAGKDSAKDGKNTDDAKDAKKSETKDITVAKITTGKPEHVLWFAAVPVSSAKVVKYDKDTGTIAPKEAPKDLMVALAYQFGDVLRTDYPMVSKNRAFVQGLFKFSKSPGDALGVAVGYRFTPVNIFVGPIWTKEDKAATSNTSAGTTGVVRDEHSKMHIRVGIGVDISSIVGWIKDAADKQKEQKKE